MAWQGPTTDEVKASVSISDVVGRDVIWDARKSNPAKGDFWAPCPFHQEKTASFHVDDRKGFYYCFGCHQKGDAISYLQEARNLTFQQAFAELAVLGGVALNNQSPTKSVRRSRSERSDALTDGGSAFTKGAKIIDNPHPNGDPLRECWRDGWREARDRENAEHAWVSIKQGLTSAAKIWRESSTTQPILLDYLAARGVDVDAMARIWNSGLPLSIRCHPALSYYEPDRTGKPIEIHRGPAMIGLIAAPGFRIGAHTMIAGIHRTWITSNGRARKNGVKLEKRWRGATGHMEAVPIRVTAHTERMIVGEGIETVLSIWSRLAVDWLDGKGPFWSAEIAKSLGALTGQDNPESRVRNPETQQMWPGTEPDWNRPAWRAPDYVKELVILGEGSAKDGEAARRRYTMAQRRHARKRDGTARSCKISLPGGRWDQDVDFADLAKAEVAA